MGSAHGLAVVIATEDPERLRVAFSLLVSVAVEGEPAYALLTRPILVEELVDADLWATVAETGVEVHSCETMSMPRFLKLTAGARLVVV